jgi:hypothetical protein
MTYGVSYQQAFNQAGAEAEEPKLNCLLKPEPNLRIAAPASFIYQNFIEINHGW